VVNFLANRFLRSRAYFYGHYIISVLHKLTERVFNYIETKVHTCRKCHSKDLTKNGINGVAANDIIVKPVAPMAYLNPENAIRRKKRSEL